MEKFEKIQNVIADALYVDKEEVVRDANLMKDLGAESIDFLDIIFRLEKEFDIKLPKGEVEKKAREGMSDDEFAVSGRLSDKALARLRDMMPEIAADQFKPGLMVRDIAALFTVATFERMVNEQLFGTTAGVSAPARNSESTTSA